MMKISTQKSKRNYAVLAYVSLALSLSALSPSSYAISVSISDNVVVLDNRQRSGEIELLSMTPSPVEFEISPADVPDGVQDGREYLRWSPARTLVPANRSTPLRMVFRPPTNLEPGEYVVRLAVQSRQVDFQPDFIREPDPDEPVEQGIAIGVAIQPVLPVTVYIRHQVDSPELSVSAFEPVSDDARSHGYFMVSKSPEAISFVGTVALIGQRTGETLTSGRLRMGQTLNEIRVRVPRRADEEMLNEPVCLHIWPTFPAQGQPEQRVCSE